MLNLSIILVNYNGSEFIYDCLVSIQKKLSGFCFEVIIVDNDSSDDSINIIKNNFPEFKLIYSQENLGFSRANNLAVKQAKGQYLLFLNTDTILVDDSIKLLLEYFNQNNDIGAAGTRIVFTDFRYQLSFGRLPNILIECMDKIRYSLDNKLYSSLANFYNCRYSKIQKVGWVTGACLVIRRDVFEQIGGFDENFFMYFEDKDICKRIKEIGYKVIYYPKTTIIHLLGGSSHGIKKSTNKYYRDSQLYYYQKHLGGFQTNILKLYLRLSGKVQ